MRANGIQGHPGLQADGRITLLFEVKHSYTSLLPLRQTGQAIVQPIGLVGRSVQVGESDILMQDLLRLHNRILKR